MVSWSKICDILEKYANRKNEITYQQWIIDLLLEMNLGWHKNQIEEQLTMQLGATERLIPDVVITKDGRNKFVMEVKEPSHIRTQKNIDQLVSYMKQLETPVGIYVGKELEVYFKNIGDGSDPKLIISLEFKQEDEQGEDFITLFSESKFSMPYQKAAIATRFASEVKYNFAGYGKFAQNYDSICRAELPNLVDTQTDEEFSDKLQLFANLLKYGHTSIEFSADVTVGTPTGGSTGNPIFIDLGWGYTGRICTRHEKLADGTEFIGIGIQPDVVVEVTESVIFGKDNVIEEARKLLK